jgi:hypothetical protein
MIDRDSVYKRTFFDKYGPEAAGYVTSAVWGLPIGLLTFLAVCIHGFSLRAVLFGLLAGLLVAALGPGIGYAFGTIWRTIAVDGGSTPSVPQYSYEQSLIMQGKVDEALASLETIIAAGPGEIRPRIIAADVYSREARNPERAAALLRQAQQIRPITAGDDIYITNRLVDLYVGPLNMPSAAMRELSHLVRRHYNTRAGDYARTALFALKQAHIIRDE